MGQEAIIYLAEILSGFAIGAFINMQIILPLFYRFPKSLILSLRRRLLLRSVGHILVTPIIWLCVLVLVYFFFPLIFLTDFVESMEFLCGAAGGIVILLGYSIVTKRGRHHLSYDFFNRTKKYKATAGINEYIYLANESLRLKQHERALKLFKEADRLEPGNPNVHLGLGICYISVLSYKEALKEYEYLAGRNPAAATKLYAALMKVGKAP